MTTLVNPTALPDETTRLLPPSTFETLTENTRGGGKGGKGGTEGANEKNEKKSNSSFALKFWPQKNTNTTEGKLREGEEEDHHPNHRVKRSGFEDASQIIHTPRRKTMGTTTTVKDDGEIEDDFANYSQMKPPRLREEDVPPDNKDDDVVGGDDDDENDDFENSGKGTRGTVLLIDKDADRENDENDENEDTLNNKNVSTAYAQKIIDRDTKWLYMKCAVLATLWFVLSASLALYNKAIFSKKGFPAPLLIYGYY